jgi:ectoine hydroxylase-related dioxygenase (phytanoyl-CoA dioxygenase family)
MRIYGKHFKMSTNKIRNKKNFYQDGFAYLNSECVKKYIGEFKKVVFSVYKKKGLKNVLKLKQDKFHALNSKILNKIYSEIDQKKFKSEIVNHFLNSTNNKKKYLVSSHVSLLIVRPQKLKNVNLDSEYVDFHRETFYTRPKKIAESQINFWVPILNVTKNQNFFYVPHSHKIKDKQIKVVREKNKYFEKFSNAHIAGMNYAPKRIIKGVNLDKALRFDTPKDNYLVLSGNLIHGGGINLTNKIRYAISFGIIEKNHVIDVAIPKSNRTAEPLFVNL